MVWFSSLLKLNRRVIVWLSGTLNGARGESAKSSICRTTTALASCDRHIWRRLDKSASKRGWNVTDQQFPLALLRFILPSSTASNVGTVRSTFLRSCQVFEDCLRSKGGRRKKKATTSVIVNYRQLIAVFFAVNGSFLLCTPLDSWYWNRKWKVWILVIGKDWKKRDWNEWRFIMIRVIDWNWYCVSMQTLKILIILERFWKILKNFVISRIYFYILLRFTISYIFFMNIRIYEFSLFSLLIIKKCFNNKRAKIFPC